MPIYRVPRTYTQVKRTEISDVVEVEAESPELAAEKAKGDSGARVVRQGEETGHHEYGEIISAIETGEPKRAHREEP